MRNKTLHQSLEELHQAFHDLLIESFEPMYPYMVILCIILGYLLSLYIVLLTLSEMGLL